MSPEQAAEIQRFAEEIAALEQGRQPAEEFKRFRLENGVYGIRESTTRFMIRAKIPLGVLSAEQLDALADVAERFTPLKLGHVTTRQDFQFHNVEQSCLPLALRRIAESGLTSREACGNTVRNVTCCPYAGVSADEAFDVTPYADALTRYFLRNPLNQNMPRKIKIAFEGCTSDHARIAIHDLGFVAKLREVNGETVRGFQVFVGGGLGPLPQSAPLLEEFVPAEWLIPSTEAVLRIFDRHGNRKDRNRARLKFLVKDWGIEQFREQFLLERKIVLATRSGKADWSVAGTEESAPDGFTPGAASERSVEFETWQATNCLPQKQAGFSTVTVRCPLGDIDVPQMRGLADLARRYCGGRIRATIAQNLVLRWVPESQLTAVHRELESLGLAHRDAEHLADVTRCPAADTCQLGITHSRGMAAALDEALGNGLGSDPALRNLSIKISGCPNSCGQHHIADIGLYGNAKTVDGHAVAHYRLLLGGATTVEKARFGVPIASLPAKRVPDAIRALLTHYRDARQGKESFRDFVARKGAPHFKQMTEPFTTLPSYNERPDLYGDLGIDGEFKVNIGKGECAA
jgi:sulfite reductase (ferredoxin)